MERDVGRSPTAARVERGNGEGCRLREQPTPMQWIWRRVERKAVAGDVQVEVGLELKRSRAVTLDGGGTEKSTIQLHDQGNVSYPVRPSA